jgi:hypothetical protein
MAKASQKNSAAAQRFKFPSLPEIVALDLDDPDELVRRGNIEALAWHSERKERYFLNLIDDADKAKMADRKWFRVLEIADALATSPGAIIPDAAKRQDSLTFVLQEIRRGEFNDQKGRSQIANLHPSSLVPVRLNTKSMKLEDIQKFTDHLWIRKQPCLDWFARKKQNIPEGWVPSRPDTQSQIRRMGKKAASQFTQSYIQKTKAAGGNPTQVGLLKAARDDGYKGGRLFLRTAFNEQFGTAKGRPKKEK